MRAASGLPRSSSSLCFQLRASPGATGKPSTAYSIELQVRTAVPEWDGQIVQAMLEEDAWFDGETCTFLDRRQTELWLI